MNGKIPSAITGIKLNRATFSNVPINGLTFVNFFYGNNGAGKSSIAYAIEEGDGITWADGKTAADYMMCSSTTRRISTAISSIMAICRACLSLVKRISKPRNGSSS